MPLQLFQSSPLGRSARSLGAASVARRLAALLAVLAMALHSVVVQPHFDVRSGALNAELSASAVTVRAEAKPQGGAHQTICVFCETAAVAGSMVLGAGPAVPMRSQFELATPEPLRVAVTAVRPSHAWRSRAPPSFLV